MEPKYFIEGKFEGQWMWLETVRGTDRAKNAVKAYRAVYNHIIKIRRRVAEDQGLDANELSLLRIIHGRG